MPTISHMDGRSIMLNIWWIVFKYNTVVSGMSWAGRLKRLDEQNLVHENEMEQERDKDSGRKREEESHSEWMILNGIIQTKHTIFLITTHIQRPTQPFWPVLFWTNKFQKYQWTKANTHANTVIEHRLQQPVEREVIESHSSWIKWPNWWDKKVTLSGATFCSISQTRGAHWMLSIGKSFHTIVAPIGMLIKVPTFWCNIFFS